MASYGPIYEFAFDSQNGADILIVISKKSYSGEVTRRPLGRAPILKRENNGHVYGTSLEIYAECKVDGEYAEFYTSSADEFKVNVYKDQIPIWTGFITPELYSEPDIAPPYDVQIIATDGLGELKNYMFQQAGRETLQEHLDFILSHTGLSLGCDVVSAVSYVGPEGNSSEPYQVLGLEIDLAYESENTCYDTLQNILTSLNAAITQFNGRWLIFRETDLIRLASDAGVEAYDVNGVQKMLDVASFGSSSSHEWWPVGQLSTVIDPAKNSIVLEAPNHYKTNILQADRWNVLNGAYFDESEGAYILPDEGSTIVQGIDFGGLDIEYRLALRVAARNVGWSDEDQPLGIEVVINARTSSGDDIYYLVQAASSDRGIASYFWRTAQGYIEAELAVPSDSDTAGDAQYVDVILPLYRNGNRSFVTARSIQVGVFNPQGTHDIHVYDVALYKYDQFKGYQSNIEISNNAREAAQDVQLTFTDGENLPVSGSVFMTGIPMIDGFVVRWIFPASPPQEYLRFMSKDYARSIALPKMRYSGVLNVPREGVIPFLFLRDNTFYLTTSYSYNLLDDELEVSLISISSADVDIVQQVITPITSAPAGSSGPTSGGGGGIGGGTIPPDQAMSDTSSNAVQNKVIKSYVDQEILTLADLLASMWSIDEAGNLVTEKQVIIKNNLIVAGDTSTEGTGSDSDTGTSGTLIGVVVNGTPYDDETNGMLDLSSLMNQYALATAIPTSLPASDVYPWAKASTKPTYTASEVGALSTSGGTMNGSYTLPLYKSIDDSDGATIFGYDLNGLKVGCGSRPLLLRGSEVTFNGNALYHTGNFNSADYLPKAGGKLSSEVLTDVLTLNSNVANAGTYLRLEYLGSKVAEFGHGWGLGTYMWCNSHQVRITSDGTAYVDNNTLLHSGNYSDYALPLSGGTISGTSANPLIINTTASTSFLSFQQGGVHKADVGWDNGLGAYIGNINSGYAISIKDEGTPVYYNGKSNTLIHSGNIGDYTIRYHYNKGAIDFNNELNNGLQYVSGSSSNGGKEYDIMLSTCISDSAWQLVGGRSGELRYRGGVGTASGWGSWKTIIHSGNIGSQFVEGIGTIYADQSINFGAEGKIRLIKGVASTSTSLGFPNRYTSGISVLSNYCGWQMLTYGGASVNNPYFRKLNDNATWSDWKQLAFIDDNVASASALLTSTYKYAFVSGNNVLFGYDTAQYYDTFLEGKNIYFRYGASHNTAMLINSSGNVLIGAAEDYGYKLQVDGSSFSRTHRTEELRLGETLVGSAITQNKWYYASIGYEYEDVSPSTLKPAIVFKTMYNTYAEGTGVERMRITSVGNVGIGITNPQYKLDVNGTARISGAVTMSNSLSVATDVTASNMFANTFRTIGEAGIWRGDWYTGALTSNDLAIKGGKIYCYGNTTINGNLVVAGDMSSTSDMRLKQRIDDVVFDLKTIAEMPIFTFRWKDGRDDRLHLGSSAQYWEKPAPWLVMGDETKTLNYAVLGVAGIKSLAVTAVDHETRIKSLAVTAVDHETRIKMLERKVNELETENRRLRYGN